MKILLANSTCKVGGVSTFLLSLRAELRSRGHECDLFFFERGPMEACLPVDCRAMFGSLADLLQLVHRERFEVVHANNVDWPSGVSAVRQLGTRLVLTAHKVREPAWTYGWHARNCDAFVTVAAWIRDELQQHTDIPIQVVHNGIDTRRFRPGEAPAAGPPIVGWVGRGSAARKRLDAFAAIAPALQRAGLRIWVIDPQDRRVFAGAWPERARALAAIAEMWEGVPFEAMPDAYHQIAASGGCLVSTASMEGLPLTLLEAQACGCPVIAADVRGVNECVTPEHGGVLFPFEAPESGVASTIIEALRDPAAARARGRAASVHVAAAFSLARMADQYLEIYAGPSPAALATHRRQRTRHSPLRHWRAYVEERLGVGYTQYDAARTLAERGQPSAAIAAARASLATAPTMYAHPRRLVHLLELWRARAIRSGSAGSLEPDPDREHERTHVGNPFA